MIKLSVVIITFNEEKNIGRCLDSVKEVADDIIIVDSFSTDKTKEIATSKGARFVEHNWIDYSQQKNYGNSLAMYDFILSLDADEALSIELREAILKIKKSTEIKAYKIKRITNYCGKWIKHCGWYPDVKVRLFDRSVNNWEGLIHEKLNLADDKAEILEGDCYHYTYYTIDEHVLQANKFSTLSAQLMLDKNKKPSVFKILFSPPIRFMSIFLLKGGFLDGYYGFLIAKISANATFLKYIKHKEMFKKQSLHQ